MAIPVEFTYYTGFRRDIFSNVRLTGSWDASGYYSEQWQLLPMTPDTGEDGCPCYKATVNLDNSEAGRQFHWGVLLDGPGGANLWGIATEPRELPPDERFRQKYLTFILQAIGPGRQQENYYLTHCRKLGANKRYREGVTTPAIQFAVWAPNAEDVKVVIGNQETGYIADDGSGIISDRGPFPMFEQPDGIWQTDIATSPQLNDFSQWDHRPYMFAVTKKGKQEGREIAYRTDLYSRCQIGSGTIDPQGQAYTGSIRDLDGTVSCSVIIDPETVCRRFQEPVWPETEFIREAVFWRDEFPAGVSLPQRVEDLVIYELHVGALWTTSDRPGGLQDTMALLPYLRDLGINAVELLPMNEFEGWARWGYGSSHFFAVEYSSGGRDQFKHFVRECHRYGIAVILDVVYNHYHHHAERAQWAYDSDAPEENIYYWYEGYHNDYPRYEQVAAENPSRTPPGHGGYLDNMSTGYAPRFYDENVRKMFISSAVALMEEFHVDGFRVDQTTSIHSYNVLHADGRSVGNANLFGAVFLRELTRTLKLIKAQVILMAEDHSEWDLVTASPDVGGLGFDAAWYANFYHQLIGDTGRGPDFSKLLLEAGKGGDYPLAMDYFAGAFAHAAAKKVVYHESHDEAGNSRYSRRTIVTAVDGAPLVGSTRQYAEARCRFCFGMAMLSPGTPMFLFGEEVGAQKDYKYDTFMSNRENLLVERQGDGQRLFRFYQDLIRFRLNHPGLRSHANEIIHVHNANRVFAFRRWNESEELLVVSSLNNNPFSQAYIISHPSLANSLWREIFNSDAQFYGGNGTGNQGAALQSAGGILEVVIPANGFMIFLKQ